MENHGVNAIETINKLDNMIIRSRCVYPHRRVSLIQALLPGGNELEQRHVYRPRIIELL